MAWYPLLYQNVIRECFAKVNFTVTQWLKGNFHELWRNLLTP